MIKVRIEHENDNRREFGYGVYVNGYVTDTEYDVEPGLYASECVPFGSSDERLKRAERRVRQNARRAYLREWNKDRQ